jgi:hypothetical protein
MHDHDLPEMPTALEMPVSLFCLSERECPVDHGVQAMHGNRPVHRLEIGAAPNADRAEGNAAASQQ